MCETARVAVLLRDYPLRHDALKCEKIFKTKKITQVVQY